MATYGVFIGRFQPFHLGHYHVVKTALKHVDRLVMVLGSRDKAPDTRDPLSVAERIDIITKSLTMEERNRVLFEAVPDFMYNDDKWIAAIQAAVFSATNREWHAGPTKILLAGMHKDDSSYYLKYFPQWDSIAVDPVTAEYLLNASDMRDAYFHNSMADDSRPWASLLANAFVNNNAHLAFLHYMEKKHLLADYLYEKHYKSAWGAGPHLTVDACIVQGGHILLIKRGGDYGYGKWAMPGGFINVNESTETAMLRELDEETGIKVPEKVLRGSIQERRLFDHPHRSLRARIVSHVFKIRLDDAVKLPKVKGADDAAEARWFSLAQVAKMRSQLFEDHYDVIDEMVGL